MLYNLPDDIFCEYSKVLASTCLINNQIDKNQLLNEFKQIRKNFIGFINSLQNLDLVNEYQFPKKPVILSKVPELIMPYQSSFKTKQSKFAKHQSRKEKTEALKTIYVNPEYLTNKPKGLSPYYNSDEYEEVEKEPDEPWENTNEPHYVNVPTTEPSDVLPVNNLNDLITRYDIHSSDLDYNSPTDKTFGDDVCVSLIQNSSKDGSKKELDEQIQHPCPSKHPCPSNGNTQNINPTNFKSDFSCRKAIEEKEFAKLNNNPGIHPFNSFSQNQFPFHYPPVLPTIAPVFASPGPTGIPSSFPNDINVKPNFLPPNIPLMPYEQLPQNIYNNCTFHIYNTPHNSK